MIFKFIFSCACKTMRAIATAAPFTTAFARQADDKPTP